LKTDRRDQPEHDACALAAVVARDGAISAWPLRHAMRALDTMAHRAGSIGEEGDGCGVQVDIPRRLWADRLRSQLPFTPGFAVAHLAAADPEPALRALDVELLALSEQDVDRAAIGPGGRDGALRDAGGQLRREDARHVHARARRLRLGSHRPGGLQ
jgi:hypothetical protein